MNAAGGGPWLEWNFEYLRLNAQPHHAQSRPSLTGNYGNIPWCVLCISKQLFTLHVSTATFSTYERKLLVWNVLSEPHPNTRFLPSKGSWTSWRPNSSRCNLHKYIHYCLLTKIFLDRPGMLYWPTTWNTWSKFECSSVERNYLGEWNAKAVRYSWMTIC